MMIKTEYIFNSTLSNSSVDRTSMHVSLCWVVFHLGTCGSTLQCTAKNNYVINYYSGKTVLTEKILGLYYSGHQSQQSFLLLSPSTHSLHVSARAGHLLFLFIIFFEASYYYYSHSCLKPKKSFPYMPTSNFHLFLTFRHGINSFPLCPTSRVLI
jgi:hypothetical protein